MDEAKGAAIRVECNGRRDADKHLQARNSSLQLLPRLHEISNVAINFLLPAARKKGKDRRIL